MYNTPNKSPRSPRRPHIDDTPIQELIQVVDVTPVDQWSKRTTAFAKLVDLIPQSTTATASDEPPEHWYNSPKTLRHLHRPIGALLKDSRSTVVKRTCESCAILFEKCGPDARYLLKDIMPAVMAVHAQTVHVIRTYVQNMLCEALPQVPCKAVMPLWLDRLKSDKSRTVREACALYIIVALETWNDPTYLTREIWSQVGNSMVRSLRDPNPVVREYVKQGLQVFQTERPDIWDAVVQDPSGPAARDPKLRRFLMKMKASDGGSMAGDELSVASRGSMASLASNRSSTRRPATTNRAQRGLGPPMRVTTGAIAKRTSPREPMEPPIQSPISPVSMHTARSNTNNGAPQLSFETMVTPEETPSAGVQELKREASLRRSRRSDIMKDRWSKSNLLENGETTTPELEHTTIARKLLRAHKKSVDGIMEIIRLEMDTLEDFEKSMRKKHVSEDEVLTYFEALGLCLDRRGKISKDLQDALDGASGADADEV
jgi:hypothetical protein